MPSDDRSDAFADRMAAILNGGALTASIAVGYRTGLFDTMAAIGRAATAGEIAGEAKLNERYVTEWLGVMGSGGIVEMDRDPGKTVRYRLPRDHARHLTRDSESGNLAVYAQEIPMLTGLAMEALVASFPSGDGIPYAAYPDFQAFMAELAEAKHRRSLVVDFLPSVGGGLLVERLKAGIRVCDLGCGEGVAAILMAEAFPDSRFVGMDIDENAIGRARRAAESLGLSNVSFSAEDAGDAGCRTRYRQSFDYITAFDAIHDQAAPLEALKSIRCMLAPGGMFSMIDIAAHSDPLLNADHPLGPFLYTVSLFHCLPVGLHNGGMGLGMMWGREKALELLEAGGFEDVTVSDIPGDPFNLHFYCRVP
jgi:SAM-dependent methyltransferase